MIRSVCFLFRYGLHAKITPAVILATVLLLYGCTGHASHRPVTRSSAYTETGLASYYARKFQNRKTASGERFNNSSFTAAYISLPFGSNAIVRNIHNGKSVTVRINDRGPFVKGRIIELSKAAFSQIANPDDGFVQVEIRLVKQVLPITDRDLHVTRARNGCQ